MLQKFSKFSNKITNFLKARRKNYTYSLQQSIPLFNKTYSKDKYLTTNEISLYLNKTTNKRAEKVGQVEFELFNEKGELVEESPLLDLLNNPNPLHPADKFWAMYQKYYDITGEAYILKEMGSRQISEDSDKLFDNKKIKNLWLIPSHKINPIYDIEKGTIEGYIYKPGDGREIRYSTEEIIFSFRPDLKAPFRGESIVKSGIRIIESETQLNEYHSRVLNNGGKIEGIFSFKEALNETQYREMKDSYEEKYSQAQKSGQPMFLGGGAEYKNLGLTPDELSFLETKKVILDDILIMTGVPKAVLGSMSDIKFSNAKESLIIFLSQTIKPLIEDLVDVLNRDDLTPEGFTLSYTDPTPQDIELGLKRAENGIKYKYMTINEAREITGLDPIEGEDELPKEEDKTMTENKIIINNSGEQNKSVHPLKDKAVREEYGKKKDAEIMKDEEKFTKVVRKYFTGQAERLIEKLEPLKRFKKKDLLDETFNTALEIKIAEETFLPELERLMIKYGDEAMSFAGSDHEFSFSGEIASSLDKKVRVFSEQINETTFKTLKEQFAESFAEGETRRQLIKRIQDTYGNIKETRAKTIARTEVHSVSQTGTFAGYKQSGLQTKIWVTVEDADVRPTHASLDGDEIPINQYFDNGLLYPGDPQGHPSETVNCRCVI